MKSLKTGTPAHGNGLGSKVSKHEVNLPKNGFLRFQVGLLFVLIVMYALLQLSFEVPAMETPKSLTQPEALVELVIGEVIPEKEVSQVEREIKPEVRVAEPEVFEVVGNAATASETVVGPSEPYSADLRVSDIPDIPTEMDPIHVNSVEFAPVFPGCEPTMENSERIDCMNEQMNVYIQKYFDTRLASEYGLSGKQRISLQFTIDAEGRISDVRVRAPHPALVQEVRRVVKKFPKMVPGMQGSRPVKVVFMKPILFAVH